MAYTVYGAIDVGSSDVSLTIYEISAKYQIRKLEKISHFIELGADSYTNGRISYQTLETLCEILLDFKAKLMEYQTDAYDAFAASAVREASNAELVVDQIRVRTGISVKIMSNSELRFVQYKALAYQKADFNKIIQKNTAIVDIGAGSIQITLFDKQHLIHTQNIRIGTLRLREILADIQFKTVNFNAILEEYVGNEIDTFQNLFLKEKQFKNLIAVGDEVFYLLKIVPELAVSDSLNREQLAYICKKLQRITMDELYDQYGIPQEIGSLLLPSAIIYKQFLVKAQAELLWTPLVNMCDGFVVNYAEEHGKIRLEHDFNEDILAAARNIAKRFRCNKIHTQKVNDIAMDIFDHIKKLHGLGKREKLLLEIAVNLHGCGKFISMTNYAYNTYHIIMDSEIIGLSHKEREIVANIARYYSEPMPSYEDMRGKLTAEDYVKIGKLTAILEIANALDRSHKQKILQYTVLLKGKRLVISAETKEDLILESSFFEAKADHFEEVYGIRPILKQRRGL